MLNYEINYLVLQSCTKDLEKIRKEIKELITKLGGRIKQEKNYLKRKLAYEIKHEKYGFYTVLRFETEDNKFVYKLTKELNVLSKIARFIIVKAEELPPLPLEKEKKEIKEEDITSQNQKIIKKEEIEEIIKKQEKEEKKLIEEKSKAIKKSEVKKAQEKKDSQKNLKENQSSPRTSQSTLDELDKKLEEILKI